MASISKDKNGTKRIVYYNADKKQECIRLGNITVKDAQTIKVHVENLLSAQAMKVSVATETADWLGKIPDALYTKFVQKGFVPPRKVVGTLGEMIPKVISEKSVGNARATAAVYEQARESLYRYFGEDRRVDKITPTEVKEYSLWLAKNGRLKKPGGLSPKTVSKRMQHAFSFFDKMIEKEIISRNPFKGLVQKVTVDDKRNRYIDEATILKIMEHASDAEWRLIIALWRFAGLRAVSEVLTLKWEDILWDQKEIVIHAPKTVRYGKGIRIIPFFPHIEECLRDAFEQAPKGAIYVVEKHAPLHLRGQKERVDVSRLGNISTSFRKIIRRAGLVPWSKLIHNLRASFETDLLNGKYGKFALTTIAKWLGHSVKVMLEHYGRIQQSDFDQIAEACEQTRQKNEHAPLFSQSDLDRAASISKRKASLKALISPSQNEGLNVASTDSTYPEKASLNASLYTAIQGGTEGHGAESPSCTNLRHVLKNKAHEGNKRQEIASYAKCPDYPIGGGGN